MKQKNSDLKVAFALFLLLMVLIPGSGVVQAQENYSMDDALLLMLAAQNRLYGDEDVEITALVANKAAKLIPLDITPQQGNSGQLNEYAQLQAIYQQWYEKLPYPDSPYGQDFLERAEWAGEQVEELEQARIDAEELESASSNPRRRRNLFQRIGNGIGRSVRFVARPVGWVAGRTLHGVGKVGKVAIRIARDEIIGRARQIVRQKLRELGDIIQGRFDMFWEHVARQVGVPVAVLLREMVVDPLYLRVRDRFQGRGEQVAQTTTEDDEGGLDESDGEVIAPVIEYDTGAWFPDGDIEITCNQFIPFVSGFEDIYGTTISYNSESSAWELWCSMLNGCCHKEVENVVTNAGYGFTLHVFQTDALAQQFTQEKMCWYTYEECTDANVTGLSECLANNLDDPGACSSYYYIHDSGMWDEGHMTTVGAVGNIMNVYFMVSSSYIDTESSRQSVTDTIGLIIQIVQERRSWQE